MAERRPFPPSPRRRALARQAGVTAASPLVVGAAAGVVALLALVALAPAFARTLERAIAAACAAAPDAWSFDTVPTHLLAVVLPLLALIALGAITAHLAQTRAAWLPRRRVPGAPRPPRPGTARAAFELLGAIITGATTFAWLWFVAPRIARLLAIGAPAALLTASALALAALGATLAIAWVGIAATDAIARHLALGAALAMTATEKREDDRLAGADPRWRARRERIASASPSDAVIGAVVVLLGDNAAVAIAWDPVRRPVPTRTALGRDARATQLVALARRHAVAIHRDAALAHRLGDREGPVPDADWAQLAEIIAAVRGRADR